MNDQRNRFLDLLWDKNQQINLVSRQMKREELDYHWDDALAAKGLLSPGQKCLDVGSGGGFPALPLAIVCQETKFLLLEAELKKVNWLIEAKQEMNLTNVEIIRGRAESLARESDLREQFEVVTARAVAEMRVLLEYTLPFVKPGGRLIAWKGPAAQQELEEAQRALTELKGKYLGKIDYMINGEQRCLLVIKKVGKVENKYPRSDGVPKKRPL